MSLYYIFSSNTKLEEARNPYLQFLSIREAMKKGIDVNLSLFEKDFDLDKPEVILYIEDEKHFLYPNIYLARKEIFLNEIQTDKNYFAVLEWEYCEEYVDVVLNYIRTHLLEANSIELWKVWLGTSREVFTPRYIEIESKNLTKEIIKKLFEDESEYTCLLIHK